VLPAVSTGSLAKLTQIAGRKAWGTPEMDVYPLAVDSVVVSIFPLRSRVRLAWPVVLGLATAFRRSSAIAPLALLESVKAESTR